MPPRYNPGTRNISTRLLQLFAASFAAVVVGGLTLKGIPEEGWLSSAMIARYGLPAALAIGCTAALRLSPEGRAATVSSIVSLAFCLMVVEGALAFRQMYPRRWAELTTTGPGDHRGPAEIVAQLRRDGIKAVPLLPSLWALGQTPAADGVLPLADPAHHTIVFCNEAGDWLTYRSDLRGFRNEDSAWASPEVALVGDSFAAGQCVEDKDSIAGHLRRAGHPTLNLGRPGRGPLEELAIIRNYLPEVQPRLVVWTFFVGNDFEDLARELAQPSLARHLAPDFQATDSEADRQAAAARIVDVALTYGPVATLGSPLALASRALTLNATRTFLRAALSPAPPPTSVEPVLSETYARIIRIAGQTVAQWRGRLVIVQLPAHSKMVPPERARAVAVAVREAAEAAGIEVLDLGPAVAADEKSYFIRPDTHYSPAGYAVVGRAVLGWMDGMKLP